MSRLHADVAEDLLGDRRARVHLAAFLAVCLAKGRWRLEYAINGRER
jgi:hypothetical protein